MDALELPRPDDWHLHLRDGPMLRRVVPHAAAVFGRAIVMPNLAPPVTTVEQATAYRQRILAAAPTGSTFTPLMTLYLTGETTTGEIEKAARSGIVHGVKMYPPGATTHSEHGVTDPRRCAPVFEAMAAHGLPLLLHGEVAGPDVDIFDREARFIDEVLLPLRSRHPQLRMVLEHVSSRAGAELVTGSDELLGATFTPQHLLYNRNDLLAGGLRPHYYCMPILKRERDREALLEAATSGHPRVFLGTDSAPHPRDRKETACGCAGCYTAPFALGLYAEAFEEAGALERLEAFAGRNGPAFYGLPVNDGTVTLQRIPEDIPAAYDESGNEPDGSAGSDAGDRPPTVVPLRAGERVTWTVRPKAA